MAENKFIEIAGEGRFQVATYSFRFRASDDIHLGKYPGSAWRGLFGHALKQAVCLTRQASCDGCMLSKKCAYPYLFETSPPANSDRMRRYDTVPHPFIFKMNNGKTKLNSGETFSVKMSLFGKGNDYLPYIIQSYVQAGRLGIGGGRSKFECVGVYQDGDAIDEHCVWRSSSTTVDPLPIAAIELPREISGKFRVHLKTPMRLLENNKPLGARNFEFHHLFRALLRRVPMLLYFHQGIDLNLPFKELAERSRGVEATEKSLRWQDSMRYSSRQGKRLNIGGLVGSFVVDLERNVDLSRLLRLGQAAHAGKATSMGNGEFVLEPMARLPDRHCPKSVG